MQFFSKIGLYSTSLGPVYTVRKIVSVSLVYFKPGMWKRKRKLEAEAVEAVNFLWKRKRKHFDERGWKWKRTRKRKC